jgi:hypothetical protein
MDKVEKFIFIKWVVIFFVIAFGFFNGCNYLNEKIGLENDNIFEQWIEKIIKYASGLGVDLSD